MALGNSRNQLIIKSLIVLSLFLFLGALLWKADRVINRTGDFPLLGPFWGPHILQFIFVALAGFVYCLPENIDFHHITWTRLVIGSLPALFVALAPVFYFQLTPSFRWLNMLFLLLIGGERTSLFVGAGAFWFGTSVALSFEKGTRGQKPKTPTKILS